MADTFYSDSIDLNIAFDPSTKFPLVQEQNKILELVLNYLPLPYSVAEYGCGKKCSMIIKKLLDLGIPAYAIKRGMIMERDMSPAAIKQSNYTKRPHALTIENALYHKLDFENEMLLQRLKEEGVTVNSSKSTILSGKYELSHDKTVQFVKARSHIFTIILFWDEENQRVEERVIDAPISIEKIDAIGIQQAAAPTFYDAIANLKGVDFSSQSLTFKSVNMRGFSSNGNLRFVQQIDGIDNQAPGLNFPVGNVVGISDLDLESAELIPGVASALYGPNAINGILLMNSKSPFEYPGFSAMVKTGVNHINEVDDDMSLYQDYSARFAKSFNDRIAFKLTASYLRAQDFVATDRRDTGPATFGAIERGATTRGDNRVYNGLNVYGNLVQLFTLD